MKLLGYTYTDFDDTAMRDISWALLGENSLFKTINQLVKEAKRCGHTKIRVHKVFVEKDSIIDLNEKECNCPIGEYSCGHESPREYF